MLSVILLAQLMTPPQQLPILQEIRPSAQSKIGHPSSKQEIQQLEEKLNVNQKNHELRQEQLQVLPPSRLDCDRMFPPAPGRDPISCSMP